MSEEISDCPFCGNMVKNEVITNQEGQNQVKCGQCGSTGPLSWTERDAIKKWNRRK